MQKPTRKEVEDRLRHVEHVFATQRDGTNIRLDDGDKLGEYVFSSWTYDRYGDGYENAMDVYDMIVRAMRELRIKSKVRITPPDKDGMPEDEGGGPYRTYIIGVYVPQKAVAA